MRNFEDRKMEGIMPHRRTGNAAPTPSAANQQRRGRSRRHRRGPKGVGGTDQGNNSRSTLPQDQRRSSTHNGPSSTGSSEKGTHQSSNQTLPKVASEEDLIDLFADSDPTDRKDMPKPEPQKHPFKVLLPVRNPSRPRVPDCGEASGRGPPSAGDEK